MQEPSGIRIGSVGKTPIYIDLSFLILCGLFVILNMERGQPIAYALLWIPVLFISILIHELGHAGAIAALGFGASRISLAGFGGYTENFRRAKPWQDVLISFAGPLMSFVLAFAVGGVIRRFPQVGGDPMMAALLPTLQWANIAWGIFNLFPVYPLDGGQIVRNLSRIVVSDETSFKFSAWSSIVIGVLLAGYGIISRSFFLAAIAGMLVFQNYQRLQMGRHLGD